MCNRNNDNESEILETNETSVGNAVNAEENDSASDTAEQAFAEREDARPTIEADASEQDSSSVTKTIFEYLELFVCSICIVLLLFMFGVRLCDVRGESMEQTLYENEKLLISDLFYTPERGDIVVFHQTGEILNEPVVKRVIATSGEWVSLEFVEEPQKIIVKIYDENKNLKAVLDESDYVYYDTSVDLVTSVLYDGMFKVPEGYLFVMGDNRNHSTDSRSAIIGLVDERRILGRVITRVYPFSKIGTVD